MLIIQFKNGTFFFFTILLFCAGRAKKQQIHSWNLLRSIKKLLQPAKQTTAWRLLLAGWLAGWLVRSAGAWRSGRPPCSWCCFHKLRFPWGGPRPFSHIWEVFPSSLVSITCSFTAIFRFCVIPGVIETQLPSLPLNNILHLDFQQLVLLAWRFVPDPIYRQNQHR